MIITNKSIKNILDTNMIKENNELNKLKTCKKDLNKL